MKLLDRVKAVLLDPEFERKREFLQRIPLFRGIPRRQFGSLFRALAVRNYHAGEVLFSEGDIGRALFILERGKVALTRKASAGKDRPLAVLEPGAYFGEMALLEERPRTATATAREEARAHLLYKTELDKILRGSPEIGAAVMTHLAQLLSARLRDALERPPQTPRPAPAGEAE